MRLSRVFFHILVVAVLVSLAIFLWFYAVSDDGKYPNQREVTPVESGPLVIAQMPPQSNQEVRQKPVVDYSRILEKYKNQDVARVIVKDRLIALTFDGGGNADGVEKIIDILSKNSIRSTFFLTGKFVEKFPKAVEEIRNSGEEIANHSYSHRDFTSLSADEVKQEVSQMKTAAEKNSITIVPFFRFPYGAQNKEDIALINNLGYVPVRWTVDSLGWQGKIENHDARFIADRVIGKAMPGAIVLMHLGSAQDKSALDADALPDVIKTLKEQGYGFVALSELFSESL